MDKRPIIALDFPNWDSTERFLSQFKNERLFVKVGMELFYQTGPTVIHHLQAMGHQIFLDLKLHDIPNTVKRSLKGLAQLGIDIVNVHAAGGSEMMEAALEGLEAGTAAGKKRPNLLAVTQLTSTSEQQMNREQLIPCTLNESVLHYAKLAYKTGLDGVVCSALEAKLIAHKTSSHFLRVTPGIRLKEDHVQDQKRVVTPSKARKLGASAIVVGRSITLANEPLKAYQHIKSAWEGIEDEQTNC